MEFPYQNTEGLEREAFKIPTPVGIMIPTPRRVEEVFNDYKGRRAGLIKALTIDVEKFYLQCDPEKEHLCLFAFPNKTWQVNPPAKMVPTELPEPLLGINFTRDLNRERDWLIQVALHSDAWLLSVAFHIAAKTGFDKNGRERLFEMINNLPTVVEVVTRAAKQENNDEIGGTLCGACGVFHCLDGFWICCDVCNRWFHGTCVKITPATAEYIEHYKCPTCSNEGN